MILIHNMHIYTVCIIIILLSLRTSHRILTSDFTVHFDELFTLRIVEWPESIKLQIYEAGLLSSSLLAEVFVPLPDPQMTSQAPPNPEPFQFTSNKVSSVSHTAVGSGKPRQTCFTLDIILFSEHTMYFG